MRGFFVELLGGVNWAKICDAIVSGPGARPSSSRPARSRLSDLRCAYGVAFGTLIDDEIQGPRRNRVDRLFDADTTNWGLHA
jgi:hypothetical protein